MDSYGSFDAMAAGTGALTGGGAMGVFNTGEMSDSYHSYRKGDINDQIIKLAREGNLSAEKIAAAFMTKLSDQQIRDVAREYDWFDTAGYDQASPFTEEERANVRAGKTMSGF